MKAKRNKIEESKRIGEKCKNWRIEHGYTQFEIAQDICISPSEISRFESGQRDTATILQWYIIHGMRGVDFN